MSVSSGPFPMNVSRSSSLSGLNSNADAAGINGKEEDHLLRSLPSNDRAAYYSEEEDDLYPDDDFAPSNVTNRGQKLKRGARYIKNGRLSTHTSLSTAPQDPTKPPLENGSRHPFTPSCSRKRIKIDIGPHQSLESIYDVQEPPSPPAYPTLPPPPRTPIDLVLSPHISRTLSDQNTQFQSLAMSTIGLLEADQNLVRSLVRVCDVLTSDSVISPFDPDHFPPKRLLTNGTNPAPANPSTDNANVDRDKDQDTAMAIDNVDKSEKINGVQEPEQKQKQGQEQEQGQAKGEEIEVGKPEENPANVNDNDNGNDNDSNNNNEGSKDKDHQPALTNKDGGSTSETPVTAPDNATDTAPNTASAPVAQAPSTTENENEDKKTTNAEAEKNKDKIQEDNATSDIKDQSETTAEATNEPTTTAANNDTTKSTATENLESTEKDPTPAPAPAPVAEKEGQETPTVDMEIDKTNIKEEPETEIVNQGTEPQEKSIQDAEPPITEIEKETNTTEDAANATNVPSTTATATATATETPTTVEKKEDANEAETASGDVKTQENKDKEDDQPMDVDPVNPSTNENNNNENQTGQAVDVNADAAAASTTITTEDAATTTAEATPGTSTEKENDPASSAPTAVEPRRSGRVRSRGANQGRRSMRERSKSASDDNENEEDEEDEEEIDELEDDDQQQQQQQQEETNKQHVSAFANILRAPPHPANEEAIKRLASPEEWRKSLFVSPSTVQVPRVVTSPHPGSVPRVSGSMVLTPEQQSTAVSSSIIEIQRFLEDIMEYRDRLGDVRDQVLGIDRRRKGFWNMIRMTAEDHLDQVDNVESQQ